MKSTNESVGMPCPQCKTRHQKGPHKPFCEDGTRVFRPDHVNCPCGVVLQYTVPLVPTGPEGWCWTIKKPLPRMRIKVSNQSSGEHWNAVQFELELEGGVRLFLGERNDMDFERILSLLSKERGLVVERTTENLRPRISQKHGID